jgi:predicted HTH transcriptional regulator
LTVAGLLMFGKDLIHADYRGQGGVIVERYRDRLEFSNPGRASTRYFVAAS